MGLDPKLCEFCKIKPLHTKHPWTRFCSNTCSRAAANNKRFPLPYTLENNYIVLSIKDRKHEKLLYEYKCRCGKIKQNYIAEIKRSAKQNYCRCNNLRTSEDICVDQLYQAYKYGVNHRKRAPIFDLTKEIFRTLVLSICFYCGAEGSNVKTVNKKHKLKYNGIDRLDNNRGYESDNVVSCCWKCNQMKKDISFTEFIEHLTKVVNNPTVLDKLNKKR